MKNVSVQKERNEATPCIPHSLFLPNSGMEICMSEIKFGCCTYTVSDEFEKDPYKTLYALKEMGYSYTEIGEFGTLSTRQWRELFHKTDIDLLCVHMGIGYLESWFEHIVEYVNDMQAHTRYIGYPALRSGKSSSIQGYFDEAKVMNEVGKKLKQRGFQLIYHNHAFEFKDLDGRCGLDILRENTDPEFVQFEIDTFWVAYGGQDPVEYIKKFEGRCGIVHLKDMDVSREFAPVGEGTLDFDSIIKTAVGIGIRNFLVEQDECKRPSLDCALSSANTIKRILSGIHV